MEAKVRALLVHNEERPVAELKLVLELQGIATIQAQSCAEVKDALTSLDPPDLVFTDAVLTDGTWADVQSLAEPLAVPVIVVSRFVDLPFYLEVLESGASDYIVPPFHADDVAYVVRSALLDRLRAPSGSFRATTGTKPEVTQHAQNYVSSGARAAHAQAGR